MMVMTRLCVVFLMWISCATSAISQAVVPTHTLRPGHLVSANDVQVSDGAMGAFSEITQIVGLEVQRVLYQGRPVQIGDVGAPALVERNEIVTLIYRTGALNIATEGRSLGRGAAGDKLRVLNLVSKNTVVGRVSKAGEVIVSRE